MVLWPLSPAQDLLLLWLGSCTKIHREFVFYWRCVEERNRAAGNLDVLSFPLLDACACSTKQPHMPSCSKQQFVCCVLSQPRCWSEGWAAHRAVSALLSMCLGYLQFCIADAPVRTHLQLAAGCWGYFSSTLLRTSPFLAASAVPSALLQFKHVCFELGEVGLQEFLLVLETPVLCW